MTFEESVVYFLGKLRIVQDLLDGKIRPLLWLGHSHGDPFKFDSFRIREIRRSRIAIEDRGVTPSHGYWLTIKDLKVVNFGLEIWGGELGRTERIFNVLFDALWILQQSGASFKIETREEELNEGLKVVQVRENGVLLEIQEASAHRPLFIPFQEIRFLGITINRPQEVEA